jgi:poly-gamma-glutamate synthesis protein (capsule biosynthesis protein)
MLTCGRLYPALAVKSQPIVLSFVGDVTLGQSYDVVGSGTFLATYNRQSPAYFLSGVQEVFWHDDLTIINLECALTATQLIRDKNETGAKYWLKGDPTYVQILVEGGVELANLANNHTFDYGEPGYQDTQAVLREQGIDFFGNEATIVCDVRGLKIGFLGLRLGQANRRVIQTRLTTLRQLGAEIVIASFHGGVENSYIPDIKQITAAHLAIDEGVDVVIGHHPHVLQGITEYRGKIIAFSLGNFCFGANRNPKDKDTMIFQLFLTKDEQGITISHHLIPASISSSAKYNDFRPKVLSGSEGERVLAKIDDLSQELKLIDP